jgi:hypothetical protein
MAKASQKGAGRRCLRRPACLVAIGLVASLGAVSAFAAFVLPARPAVGPATSLTLRAEPSSRTVAPGASARFALHVARGRLARVSLSGLTTLSINQTGLPAGADVSFSPRRGIPSPSRSNPRSTLTVTTAPSTPPGAYTLTVQAERPHRSGSTAVRFVVSDPGGAAVTPSTVVAPSPADIPGPPVSAPEAFTIAGTVPVALMPGSGQPLDLTLTSLEDFDLSISSLTVTVTSVSAPESDSTHTCGAEDFSVEQFSGAPGFTLPAMSTVSLSALGFAASEMPQVSMLNLPVNQDGCKSASFSLAFAGAATEVAP